MLPFWLLCSFPTGPWLHIKGWNKEDEIGGGSGINKPNTVASYILAM